MLNCGHRGASGTEPENTLRAFKAALAMGADSIELDVHRCKSGELVVIHDGDVSRTTNGTGKISELTLEEIRQLDAGKGERIPTLDEALAAVKGGCRDGSDPTVFVEVKSPGGKEVAKAVHRAVASEGWSYDKLPVIGFNHLQIGLIKRGNPDIQTGISLDKKKGYLAPALIGIAKLAGASAINPHHALVTPEWVEQAHKSGLKVNTWTVNEHEDIKRVAEAGVDAIIGNFPDRTRLITQAVSTPQKSAGKASGAQR